MGNNILLKTQKILGVKITISILYDIYQYISYSIYNKHKVSIFTPNPEIITQANHVENYQKILNQGDINIPDGRGVFWAGKILGLNIKKTIPGIDFMQNLCAMAEKNGWSIFLLGGRNGVAVKTRDILSKKYPQLNILGFYEGSAEEKSDQDTVELVKKQCGKHWVDIIFVAYGAPKQEYWIDRNLSRLPVSVAMGVGGAFNYISGKVSRAPKWVRNLGFEWLYRLCKEPWR